MGRPREHDEQTRERLRAAAERIVAEQGLAALSVRTVADAAQTTTRAVYSTYGSKDGLVDALAETAFAFLSAEIAVLPDTADPVTDLVNVAVKAFRRLALVHPALYRAAFQRGAPGGGPELTAARQRVSAQVHDKIRRLERARLLGLTSVRDATVAIEAMIEGLAAAELRGRTNATASADPHVWRRALVTLVRGFRGFGA